MRNRKTFFLSAMIFFLLSFLGPIFVGASEISSSDPYAVLVAPDVLDLGIIDPGGRAKGIFFLKSPSSQNLNWYTQGPEEWSMLHEKALYRQMKDGLGYLEVSLKFVGKASPNEDTEQRLQMTIESDGDTIVSEKELPYGKHQGIMNINYDGGSVPLTFKFETVLSVQGSKLHVEPLGLDFGTVEGGKTVTKKFLIRNIGKGTLTWKVASEGVPKISSRDNMGGFYVSFLNEDHKRHEEYRVPARLENVLQASGAWLLKEGYPFGSVNDTGIFTFSFTGTAIALIVRLEKSEGVLKAAVDDGPSLEIIEKKIFIDGTTTSLEPIIEQDALVNSGAPVATHDRQSLIIENLAPENTTELPIGERVEVLIAENLREGRHVLVVVNEQKAVQIEGVKIFGSDILVGIPGGIKVFPSAGTTRSEIDYVTVAVNTENLKTGHYCERVLVKSNESVASVDVSLRVTQDHASKMIDVYRYVKGKHYLYTGEPEAEDYYTIKNYTKQRLAFRLFREEIAGTRKFLRWYNAQKGDRVYTTDPEEGAKLPGYVFEGSIGNIGTSKILGTRELYRWRNPSTGCHFYTIDPKGEGMEGNGYRFDGIVGYVR
jgi:hypothetical protein